MMNYKQIDVLPISASPSEQMLAAFVPARSEVWKEDDSGITPQKLRDGSLYMPWGANNDIPYEVLDKIEQDETMSTCQQHNIKNCYACGLEYALHDKGNAELRKSVEKFITRNDLTSYYLGVCTDMKFWQFAVTVLRLSADGNEIAGISRKEAMYCRLSPATEQRQFVFYANWRKSAQPDNVKKYPLLDAADPLGDLEYRLARTKEAQYAGRKPTKDREFAVITRIPTPDSTYYPIPYYASLFKGKWYDIKQLIALGKYAKLKHAAPLKYIVQVADTYWERVIEQSGATTDSERENVIKATKDMIIDYLTGIENAGKTLFTGAFVDPVTGKAVPDVQITCLERAKEGGDWETDIQEAINMVCFTMGVHSNLVGSVPGKTQSNNSGSDKRELYMIAQLLNKPTHDLLLRIHRLICVFNGWSGVTPACRIMQLTTLDEHKDIKPAKDNGEEDNQ